MERAAIPTYTATPSRHTYAVATGSGRNIIVPSAYASSIASSWDPRHRSIWFQRKAVIITSIFLAIFIVLIIGAAAFIRDKREAEAEGEVDISDEAALKRMKEEREMRAGRKGSKKQKDGRESDNGSTKEGRGGGGKSTGIVLRWVKMPKRRLKKRKGKTSLSHSSHSTESITYQDSPSPRHNSANYSQSLEIVNTSGTQTSLESEEAQQSTAVESIEDGHRPSSSNREPLSVGDLTAAEAEAERQLHSSIDDQAADAFPPAYISGSRDYLHPSANRTLMAGSSSSRATLEGSSDEKRDIALNSTNDAGNDDEEPPSLLPTITEARSSDGQNHHYSGHIATDDKILLGQMHHAASTPSAPSGQSGQTNDMSSSNESFSLQSGQVSAPLVNASAPDFDVTQEELGEIEAGQGASSGGKGKSTLQMLPAPPAPLSSLTFSRFDMPYGVEALPIEMARSSTVQTEAKSTCSSSEKDLEAEEERRKALAIIESRPEDMAHLPKYESHQQPPKNVSAMPSAPDFSSAAPSAPAEEDDDHDHQPAVIPLEDGASALPSAPPAED